MLPGGITNQSYLVSTSAGKAVLRLNAPNELLLGINRSHEAQILNAVVLQSIAPEVWYQDRQAGVMVTSYSEGEVYSALTLPECYKPALIRVLESVRKTPVSVPVFDYASYLACYRQRVEKIEGFLPEWEDPWSRFERQLLLWQTGFDQVALTHHDLGGNNIIVTEERILLIDWEYAGLGCPSLDLLSCGLEDNSPQSRQEMAVLENILLWLDRLWNALATRENA